MRSSSSGRKGSCTGCNHLNSEHTYEKCKAKGCRKQWKICQVNGQWRLCAECTDHPGGGPDGTESDDEVTMRNGDRLQSTTCK
ncbi:hypothetical protein P154DRAFT_255434 [Amniculicola lignicola CBS 123094]|uniref:Uncharacterized protein n=1 Tax=Amniculicola lignicola CBS 123094 TaxID=1392246 RepID=A0A6A5X1Z6_9PLEO|nr:hypothetical protein P154DRAFT_255434 [Amniculicola lignicola CBS 123094]